MDMGDTMHPLMALPFYAKSGDSFVLWSQGLENGRALADSAISFMRECGAPNLLGQVAKAQIVAGGYGRTEISFWQRVAEHALR